MNALLRVTGLDKTFTLHLQGGRTIPVFHQAGFAVRAGECVVLAGASGVGKSTLLRLVYGNYKAAAGEVWVRHRDAEVDLVTADPRTVFAVRRETMGYVSQFLRCLPRVPAVDVVAEPLLALGVARDEARVRARVLLQRLRIPSSHLDLAPATFSGGEQQRVNIARGFAHPYPLLLLDEPTASLDAANRATVVELIQEAKARGAALLGIFHDADVRDRVADRFVDVEAMRAAA
ncbi:MAG: phosphonate C-P lyase system protein PhnL [Geminicoccaceae bacterium]|nr:MAG: phosphonate C-P lyase system protein PhnL [Geminicoccaceae bacterium]